MTTHGITLKQLRESKPSNEDFSDIEESTEARADLIRKYDQTNGEVADYSQIIN